MACILLWNSPVRVRDSQAYRKMDVTRERISRILELREILLSIQTGINLVNAAVVCAILESISGLEPPSVITEPKLYPPLKAQGQNIAQQTISDLCHYARAVTFSLMASQRYLKKHKSSRKSVQLQGQQSVMKHLALLQHRKLQIRVL